MMNDIYALLEPGMLVRNPRHPEWGLGQVQSRIGTTITVMFDNAGKIVMNGRNVALELVYDT